MTKQKKIQLSLLFMGIILFVLTYFYYPAMKKKQLLNNKNIENIENIEKKNIKEDQNDQYTSFENIEYEGLYDFNKPFKVKSEKAYTLNSNPDVVFMDNMHVIMYLNDGRVQKWIS